MQLLKPLSFPNSVIFMSLTQCHCHFLNIFFEWTQFLKLKLKSMYLKKENFKIATIKCCPKIEGN